MKNTDAFAVSGLLSQSGGPLPGRRCAAGSCPSGFLLAQICGRIQMVNMFKGERTAGLNDFSVVTTTPGTKVSCAVCLLGEGFESLGDSVLLENGEHSCATGGYHRFRRTTPRVLTKGQKYSVVIRKSSDTSFGGEYCEKEQKHVSIRLSIERKRGTTC